MTTPDGSTVYNATPSLIFDGSGSVPGKISDPQGVVVHHLTDVIYVADSGNDRVCGFNPNGDVISCMSGYTTVDDTESFIFPNDVSVLPDGRMVISDEHRVMLMYTNMTIIHVWGSKSLGTKVGKFEKPMGVASDGYRIYVADRENDRIQILNITSTDDIQEIKVRTYDSSLSYEPNDIAVDPVSGEMFVTGNDNSGNFIFVYDFAGHYVRHFTPAGLSKDDIRLYQIALYKGQVYVTDQDLDCIHIMSYNGSYIQRIGLVGGTCPGCFRHIFGVAVHSVSGYIIATDNNNHNIKIFTPL